MEIIVEIDGDKLLFRDPSNLIAFSLQSNGKLHSAHCDTSLPNCGLDLVREYVPAARLLMLILIFMTPKKAHYC